MGCFHRPRFSTRFSTFNLVLVTLLSLGVSACSTEIPEGMQAIRAFDVSRYTGTWYEIARLDHSFERGLTHVRADYQAQGDGSIRVRNQGYDPRKGRWDVAMGRALFLGDPQVASLKVSFFGPFYGGYHVIALDHQHYAWSMVAGPNRDYLWILAREPRLSDDLRQTLVTRATELGFATQQLVWVDHTTPVPPPPEETPQQP